jgi:hypothetical protein
MSPPSQHTASRWVTVPIRSCGWRPKPSNFVPTVTELSSSVPAYGHHCAAIQPRMVPSDASYRAQE